MSFRSIVNSPRMTDSFNRVSGGDSESKSIDFQLMSEVEVRDSSERSDRDSNEFMIKTESSDEVSEGEMAEEQSIEISIKVMGAEPKNQYSSLEKSSDGGARRQTLERRLFHAFEPEMNALAGRTPQNRSLPTFPSKQDKDKEQADLTNNDLSELENSTNQTLKRPNYSIPLINSRTSKKHLNKDLIKYLCFGTSMLVLISIELSIHIIAGKSISEKFTTEISKQFLYKRCEYYAYCHSAHAEECYEALLSRETFVPRALYNLAEIKSSQGYYISATELLKRYVDGWHTTAGEKVFYAENLVLTQEIDAAIAVLTSSIEVFPDHIPTIQALFDIYDRLNDHAKIADFGIRLLNKVYPTEKLLKTVFESLIILKEIDEAKRILYNLQIVVGDDEFYYNGIIFIEYNYGSRADAARLLEEAHYLYPQNLDIAVNRSLLLYHNGDYGEFLMRTEQLMLQHRISSRLRLLHAWALFKVSLHYEALVEFIEIKDSSYWGSKEWKTSVDLIDHVYAFKLSNGYYCTQYLYCVFLPCEVTSLLSFIFVDTNAIQVCKHDRAISLQRLSRFNPSVTDIAFTK